MAKVIMVQGTMSNAGKSLLAAGLCRVFHQDGYRAVPFKSQNMALNSFITEDGLEMGRAQVMQAQAAGVKPDVSMNPILLKPTNHTGSQVIVNGEVVGNMSARDYFAYKTKLIPDILKAFRRLEQTADIIVIEGAGSPAEINLKENDIVNMGMAELVDAPVLLVGDIDRGGVFAQLLGTLMLLETEERNRVKGLVINKFRGDKTILDPGIQMLEEKGGIPVTGVIPYTSLMLEDEDSLTERFDRKATGLIDLAVIRYPRISNFSDFNVFEQIEGIGIRYVTDPGQLGRPDLILLPGSKNTMGDLKWLRGCGLEAAIKKLSDTVPVFGICGGYQMLGAEISDPLGTEEGGSMKGMQLLPVKTILRENKTRCQVSGIMNELTGPLSGLSGKTFTGYEIHMGETRLLMDNETGNNEVKTQDGRSMSSVSCAEAVTDEKRKSHLPVICQQGSVYGTYVHGIFDHAGMVSAAAEALARRKGVSLKAGECLDYEQVREREFDKLADVIREYMDMDAVYGMLREVKYD